MYPSNPAKHSKESRFQTFALVALAGFGSVGFGLLRLQIADHEEYRRLAQENRVRLEVLRAPRGAIFDRNGTLLADNAPSFNIVFRPMPAESIARVRTTIAPEWLARVSGLVEQDTAAVREWVRFANRSGQTAVLRRNAPFSILAAVEETRGELPGLEVVVEPMRRYPHGTLGAHLLGYAGEINEAELTERKERGYRSGDLIGRTGVERTYEEMLRGQDGAEFVVVNAMGKRVSTLTEGPPRPPVPGHDLVLTVDFKVQQALEEVMADVDRGAAVALDPRDGAILGAVSRPAFDPNEFSRGLSLVRWRELSGGGANPLLNRAIQGVYPPGSTFKMVTMLAALRAGVARPETRLHSCGGSYYFGGRSFGCWKRTGHGSLDFVAAIQHSCDVYFYQIGPRLGLPRLEAAARELGLGERTGIDLPGEAKGLIPSEAWYAKRWGAGRMPKGLLLNLAIGQGELLATPLQLALMAAGVASGGQPVRPHVVLRVQGDGEAPAQEKPVQAGANADPSSWRALHEGLELVVAQGTGTASRVQGVRVAGKTGTAQNPHGDDHALFVCYAPAEKPTIVLAFVIENSGHGGSVAAPRAGQVLKRVFLPDSVALHPIVAAPVDTTEVARGD
ncbi:MAG TPA: penicillin-binding protein 2 [Candidatus Limnocylindria bacterium]|nr:penicillin-binding protein 2 [Candidatus Limnocylindria bacterium]